MPPLYRISGIAKAVYIKNQLIFNDEQLSNKQILEVNQNWKSIEKEKKSKQIFYKVKRVGYDKKQRT